MPGYRRGTALPYPDPMNSRQGKNQCWQAFPPHPLTPSPTPLVPPYPPHSPLQEGGGLRMLRFFGKGGGLRMLRVFCTGEGGSDALAPLSQAWERGWGGGLAWERG
jgi:hypothetical protein